MFSRRIAASVGKTVRKHGTKLRSGLNFPAFTFVGDSVKVSPPAAADCIESQLGDCHLLAHRLGERRPSLHGMGGEGAESVLERVVLKGSGIRVLLSYFESE